jgi:hypothetical protein
MGAGVSAGENNDELVDNLIEAKAVALDGRVTDGVRVVRTFCSPNCCRTRAGIGGRSE